MFTGLIEATGTVERLTTAPTGTRLRVATPLASSLQLGESVAVNGVCLTVASTDSGGWEADVSPETLRVTTLGGLASGRRVNLERALRAGAALGGHFVLGHIDATGRVVSWAAQGDSWWLEIELPATMAPWVVEKGSLAVDGISLTIASLTGNIVGLQIVPFTRAHTALADCAPGDTVNLEADIIGKYVARAAQLR
jgi:riboflavin synthase